MNFKERITNNKFSLVVSLPSNSLELAEAALEGGAMAVKVHCNVYGTVQAVTHLVPMRRTENF